jgi:hypothetical protein
MKVPTGLLAVTLLLAGAGTSHAGVRIARDQGGQIGRYVDRFKQLRAGKRLTSSSGSGKSRAALRRQIKNIVPRAFRCSMPPHTQISSGDH